MSATVKNGTPLHGPSLCETCTRAQMTKGYRESEEVVICQATYPELRVTFPVRECSRYVSKGRQLLRDMEEIAWVLTARGPKRKAGFVPPVERKQEERQIELILDQEK
jgi:hypothetical protein